jgi:hypothetical protein
VSERLGERPITGDDRCIKRLCQGDVHGVVRSDVVSQPPRAPEEVEMGVTVEIEGGEIRIASSARPGETSPCRVF